MLNLTLIKRFGIALTLAASAISVHAADHAGTDLQLQTVPGFLQRLFVPVVPEAENLVRIDEMPITAVSEVPPGFRVERVNGGVRITSSSSDVAGYAKVRAGDRDLILTLVSLVPYTHVRAGMLDGYRIGEYSLNPLRGLSSYKRPNGFVRLTPANSSLWVSDHYRLRDFQCKLDGASKFLIVRPEALVKLELMQNLLQTRRGLNFDRFTIMSGFRTPFYNSIIGNETSNSRHLYGDAMDIYIDQDRNGSMDDINRDGRVNAEDARFLLQAAEAIDTSREWGWLKGGAGVYHANSAHGPYLHIDARGYVARWGI